MLLLLLLAQEGTPEHVSYEDGKHSEDAAALYSSSRPTVRYFNLSAAKGSISNWWTDNIYLGALLPRTETAFQYCFRLNESELSM
jgi:hypothetical protein